MASHPVRSFRRRFRTLLRAVLRRLRSHIPDLTDDEIKCRLDSAEALLQGWLVAGGHHAEEGISLCVAWLEPRAGGVVQHSLSLSWIDPHAAHHAPRLGPIEARLIEDILTPGDRPRYLPDHRLGAMPGTLPGVATVREISVRELSAHQRIERLASLRRASEALSFSSPEGGQDACLRG